MSIELDLRWRSFRAAGRRPLGSSRFVRFLQPRFGLAAVLAILARLSRVHVETLGNLDPYTAAQ